MMYLRTHRIGEDRYTCEAQLIYIANTKYLLLILSSKKKKKGGGGGGVASNLANNKTVPTLVPRHWGGGRGKFLKTT